MMYGDTVLPLTSTLGGTVSPYILRRCSITHRPQRYTAYSTLV